jgi:hypothetical protein
LKWRCELSLAKSGWRNHPYRLVRIGLRDKIAIASPVVLMNGSNCVGLAMMWADRAAIGLLGLTAIIIALILAVSFLGPSDFFPITATNVGRAVGWFLGTGVPCRLAALARATNCRLGIRRTCAPGSPRRKRISAAEEP